MLGTIGVGLFLLKLLKNFSYGAFLPFMASRGIF